MKYVIRLSSITAVLLACFFGAALFWVSQSVQKVEREQQKILSRIEGEEEALRVLEAEWDYLNRPDRLQVLAEKYLSMVPPQAEHILKSASMVPVPPMISEEEQVIEVQSGAALPKPVPVEVPNKPDAAPIGGFEKPQESSFDDVLKNIEREEGAQ